MTKAITHIILLLFIIPSAYAESLRFKLLNSQDGLPQNTVRAITQDQNGLMWFATEDGIARYDGQTMKVFRYRHNDQYSLPENVVMRFLATDQQLWVGTQGKGGVSVLKQTTQEFYPVKNIANAPKEASLGNVVFALYQRTKDEILVGSENGVFSISSNDLTVTKQLISKNQLQNKRNISAIWEDPQSNLWVASTDGQLVCLEPDGKLIHVVNDAGSFDRFRHIPALGDVLITSNGLMKLDYEKKQLTPLFSDRFLKDVVVKDIAQSSSGDIWIATRSGLIRYDPVNDVAMLAAKNSDDENSLPTNELTTLHISDEGILWIGSSDKGVIYTNIKGFGFTSYSTHDLKIIHPKQDDPEKLTSFKNNMIWSIFRDSRDTLWIGHTEGLDSQKNGADRYTHHTKLGKEPNRFDISESWLMSITEANGYLWFGTWGEGLLRYDPLSEAVVVYSSKADDVKHRLSGNVIRLLVFDEAKNVLWVGTHYHGLNRIDFDTEKIKTFTHDPKDINSLPHHRTRALHLDDQGKLWVGTGDGVALFDEATQQFKRVKKDSNSEATTDIRGLYRADENTLWSATDNGLDRINIQSMQIEEKYLEEDGLSRSSLYGIVPDSDGNMWLPSTRGLTQFNPKEKSFKRYFLSHNLQSNEFNFNAYLKEKDGSLVMGGVGGITRFNPAEVKSAQTQYEPVILSIKSIDDDFLRKRVLGTTKESNHTHNRLNFDANQRTLIIDFVIPEYTFAGDLRYEYQLLGSQNQWLKVKPRSTPIRYTNLKAGDYTFQVRRANVTQNGVKPLTIHITIGKHYWETWWFTALLLAIFGLLSFCIIRSFSTYRLEKKVAQERAEAYGMVVHDLGPALQRTQNDLTTLRMLSNDNSEAGELLNDLVSDNQYSLTFINQLRSISTVEGFSKKSMHDFLLEDIVDESLNHFRIEKERIKVNNIPDCTVRAYENSIEFILINLIANALKYSDPDTTVTVDIQQHANKYLVISVADNGTGISETFRKSVFKPYERGDYYKTEGLGIGLTLVKSITQKYQGDISITNNQPNGTVMRVTLNNIVVSA